LALYKDLGRFEALVRVELRISSWLVLRDSTPAHVWHDRLSILGSARRDLETDREPDSFPGQDRERQTSLVRLQIAAAAAAAIERGDVEEALTESRQAMQRSAELGDAALRVGASILHADGLFLKGNLGESFALYRRASDEADRLNDAIDRALAIQLHAYDLMALRDPTAAIYLLQRELEKPHIAQAPRLRAVLFDFLRTAELFAGKLPAGSGLPQLHGDNPRSIPDLPLTRELDCLFAGQWERADLLYSQAADQARQSKRYAFACDRSYGLAKVRRALGQLSEAEAILQENLVFCIHAPCVVLELKIRGELASIHAQTGRPEQAYPHLERCREVLAAEEDWRGVAGLIARADATVAAAEARFETADQQFASAVEIFRRYRVPFEQAETLHYWGRTLLAAGDRERGFQKLDAATEIYQRHGAGERWLERVQADRLRAQSAGG
jgi:tetratricopeptide (TPR) repeat protein